MAFRHTINDNLRLRFGHFRHVVFKRLFTNYGPRKSKNLRQSFSQSLDIK